MTDLQKKKDDGIFSNIGIFSKIILGALVILIVTVAIFGLNLSNIPQFFVSLCIVAASLGAIYIIIRAAMVLMEPKAYSPSGDFLQKMVNIAMLMKSPNVHGLWLRGEAWQGRSFLGEISGIGFIPYLTSKVKKDKSGKILFLTDEEGNLLKDRNDKPIPQREIITQNDGDILFVIKQGWFGMGKPLLIRCHRSLCNAMMVGEIYIKSAGMCPYGDWLYPSIQWQESIKEIMIQNEIETTQMTHASFLDLIADSTRISISASPEFAKLLSIRSEGIMSTPVGSNMQYQQR